MVVVDPNPESSISLIIVARKWDRVLLCEYSSDSEEAALPARLVALRVLGSAATFEQHPRLTVTDRKVGALHYVVDLQYIYIAITDSGYPQRTVFKCLDELKRRFQGSFGEMAHRSKAGGLSEMAKALLAEVHDHFCDAASVDKVRETLRDVQGVSDLVHESMHEMLATQDNLEVLDERADNMAGAGRDLFRRTRRIKAQERGRSCVAQMTYSAARLFLFVMLASLPVGWLMSIGLERWAMCLGFTELIVAVPVAWLLKKGHVRWAVRLTLFALVVVVPLSWLASNSGHVATVVQNYTAELTESMCMNNALISRNSNLCDQLSPPPSL